MEDRLFVDICRRQYGACFAMIRELATRCPEELWDRGDAEPPFWQQAYHTLMAIDFYLAESPDACRPPAFHVKGMNELGKTPASVLTRGQLVEYLDRVAAEFENLARRLEQTGLADQNPFPWTGPTVADRMAYNLRHAQHHLGWMASILRRNGVEPAEWVCAG